MRSDVEIRGMIPVAVQSGISRQSLRETSGKPVSNSVMLSVVEGSLTVRFFWWTLNIEASNEPQRIGIQVCS